MSTNNKAPKDDPSRTAGIPNWGWLLLFVVLAATPIFSVVKSWRTPSPETYQTSRPAPTQSQNATGKAPTETEKKLSDLEARLDELKAAEKKLNVLEARLDDTYSTVEAVGFSAGLFGVLITVITLFFALKESERVKDAMNRISEMEITFKSADGIQQQVQEAKREVEATKRDVEYALSKAQEARTDVYSIYDRYADTKKEAMQALDTAREAQRLGDQMKKELADIQTSLNKDLLGLPRNAPENELPLPQTGDKSETQGSK